jgi:hypothetical protein
VRLVSTFQYHMATINLICHKGPLITPALNAYGWRSGLNLHDGGKPSSCISNGFTLIESIHITCGFSIFFSLMISMMTVRPSGSNGTTILSVAQQQMTRVPRSAAVCLLINPHSMLLISHVGSSVSWTDHGGSICR